MRERGASIALGLLVAILSLMFVTSAYMASTSMLRALLDGDPTPKVAITNPADSPNTVYVLQSFYKDEVFVDGVFSSVAEAEQWMEEVHGSFERSEPDTMNVYEAGDFTYLITTYEVDDHG